MKLNYDAGSFCSRDRSREPRLGEHVLRSLKLIRTSPFILLACIRISAVNEMRMLQRPIRVFSAQLDWFRQISRRCERWMLIRSIDCNVMKWPLGRLSRTISQSTSNLWKHVYVVWWEDSGVPTQRPGFKSCKMKNIFLFKIYNNFYFRMKNSQYRRYSKWRKCSKWYIAFNLYSERFSEYSKIPKKLIKTHAAILFSVEY